jgi:tetratricopeptide (TPR) repeat protein
LLIAAAPLMSSCGSVSRLRARNALNKGVRAFTEQKYDKASASFQESIMLDPDLEVARMYLAATYTTQFVPGSPDPKSLENAEKAITTFKDVIEKAKDKGKPNISAMLGVATLYYHLKKYNESKEWCAKIQQVDPGNMESPCR